MTVPVRWLRDRAELLAETGRVDEAIAEFERMDRLYGSPEYTLRLALLYRERGRKNDYLAALGRASEQTRRMARYGVPTSLLVTHGLNDPRVPVEEARQIVRAVRKNDQKVWYVVADDEGHGFAKKANAEFSRAVITTFWKENLLPKD